MNLEQSELMFEIRKKIGLWNFDDKLSDDEQDMFMKLLQEVEDDYKLAKESNG